MDPFPGPVDYIETQWQPLIGLIRVAGGERVPRALLCWYFSLRIQAFLCISRLLSKSEEKWPITGCPAETVT